MIKHLITRKSSVLEATAILAVASLVSRLFGVMRDSVIAARYAGDISDAYLAAFVIPDFIFNLLILGALSSAFIPIFTEYLQKTGSDKEEAWGIVNSLVNLGVMLLAVILLAVAVFAPTLVHLVAPGFVTDKKEMVVVLMRVMLLSPLFFGFSNLAGGILNSFKNFFAYAIAPILYNLGIIAGAIYLVPKFGYIGLAYGVVGGACLHMLVQLPGVFAFGYRYRLHMNLRHPAIQRMAMLMIPRTIGIGVTQISTIINTAIASTLAGGAVSVFKWADNLQSLPIGIFGVSFAVAVFPTLAEKYSLKKIDEFKEDVVQVLRQVMFFIVPSMLLYWLLRAQIVRLVFGYGLFGWDYTRFTVSALAFFTFGMLGQSIIHLLARSFYALQDTKTPLLVSIGSLGLNVGLALILVQYLDVVGLAAAISISATVNAGLLLVILGRRLGGLPWRGLSEYLVKIIFAGFIMTGAGYLMLRVMNLIVTTHTVIGLFAQTVVTAGVAVLVYLAITRVLKIPEVSRILSPFRRLVRVGK
ncbi:murein biosynthesis integral membrane protein MurJ [candidate division Kazan bacterium RIFCSPHIGHO2_01_FULL_44_14]|uniref:Probable lipid II flippase MurJ n=1 Tax=candidate division Kazan bacterium RIFCSPLOWO2_01_FULL_45_19 TaxID=1798538 RepID=A0A1F4NQH2_UNCK3|nr:hypothetical protein [uncultured bacterium]OGB73701.1 MAG: murein biosynthesis integral membrane protein MurJ [candidate division Kazan bacterium RIFCSPLOWO2_01_FULL_45_19]OGB77946.1 MAG: murein biosynthesis integral membrane protein MurJ [candidate division Kazan bacterium RIFCSPHIGHO2_01_FULL_44_14]